VKRTAIVGIGSHFGDDRAGWLVIDALEATLDRQVRAAAGVTLVALDRPGAMLLEHLRGVDRAVLVDSVRGGGAAGTLLRLDASQLQADRQVSSHGFGVAEALLLGAALNVLPPELTVLALATGPGTTGTNPSPQVRRGVARLARELRRWVKDGATRDLAQIAPPGVIIGALATEAMPGRPSSNDSSGSRRAGAKG
jgi:hydrogenase maturation protease